MDGVGFTAHWNTTGMPLVMPPLMPPLWLVAGHHPPVPHAERVVDLRTAAAGHGKAAAELDALDAADGEHRVAQQALHAVEPRLAHARRAGRTRRSG